MRKPISPALLHDKKFVNSAEAFVRKKMLNVPFLAAKTQPVYTTCQSTAGLSLGVHTNTIEEMNTLS
jgi:hypothetical protein